MSFDYAKPGIISIWELTCKMNKISYLLLIKTFKIFSFLKLFSGNLDFETYFGLKIQASLKRMAYSVVGYINIVNSVCVCWCQPPNAYQLGRKRDQLSRATPEAGWSWTASPAVWNIMFGSILLEILTSMLSFRIYTTFRNSVAILFSVHHINEMCVGYYAKVGGVDGGTNLMLCILTSWPMPVACGYLDSKGWLGIFKISYNIYFLVSTKGKNSSL